MESDPQRDLEKRFAGVLAASAFVQEYRSNSWMLGQPISLPKLADTLEASGKLFVDWRYQFGNDPRSSQNFIHQAQEALRQYIILDAQYDWAAKWMRDDWYHNINRLEPDPLRRMMPPNHEAALDTFPNEPKTFEKGCMLIDNSQLRTLGA